VLDKRLDNLEFCDTFFIYKKIDNVYMKKKKRACEKNKEKII